MELIKYEDKQVTATLRQTVAAGLTEAEFSLFVQFCQGTGLNPFKKEIWAIKAGGKLQLMTGLNGFRAIANAHPAYDGIEIGLIGKGGEYLSATYPGEDYVGAWARCHRKDRKVPRESVAMLKDYDKGFGNWKVMRRVMILKCAESNSLRADFAQLLNGLYTEDEMPAEFGAPPVTVKPARKPLAAPVAEVMKSIMPELDSPNRPSAEQITEGERDPGSYVITTACKFAGKTLDAIHELDPNWISGVLSDPAKVARLNALDETVMQAFAKRLTEQKPIEASLV